MFHAPARALFALALAIPLVPAQSRSLVADIPFDFSVGDQRLPAGRYEILPVFPHAFKIASPGRSSAHATFMANGAVKPAAETSSLVFLRASGGALFLDQLWHAGSNSGFQLTRSRRTRQLLYRTAAAPHPVTIAAR